MSIKDNRLLKKRCNILIKFVSSGEINPHKFLLQGLMELEKVIEECNGNVIEHPDFYEMDMRFNDVLHFIRVNMPDCDVVPYEKIYEKIMTKVYKSSPSPVLDAPYLTDYRRFTYD
ncbi:MAG: hypothetical protein QXW97_02410 [Candidatus Pacearchaeota archaeon]